MQCLHTQQPGTEVSRLNTPQSEISNVLKVFDICLELPSNSGTYFGFAVDKFSELVHTRKSRRLRPPVKNAQNLNGICHSNVLGYCVILSRLTFKEGMISGCFFSCMFSCVLRIHWRVFLQQSPVYTYTFSRKKVSVHTTDLKSFSLVIRSTRKRSNDWKALLPVY